MISHDINCFSTFPVNGAPVYDPFFVSPRYFGVIVRVHKEELVVSYKSVGLRITVQSSFGVFIRHFSVGESKTTSPVHDSAKTLKMWI